MKLASIVFSLIVLSPCWGLAAAPESSVSEPITVSLWVEGKAPNGDGTFDPKNAVMTVHRPAKPNGAVIVICPGGGYGGVVIGPEGHGIAKWLNEHGITGVVLRYRLPRGRSSVPLLDVQQAVR